MATAPTAAPERLLTIQEYMQLPDNGVPNELVRGRVIPLTIPIPWHGFVCGKVCLLMGGFAELHDLGYPVANNAGIITERDPDSVRGADFAFYSYQRLPKGTLAKKGYLAVTPDLAVEVKSPDDRWKDILAKVAEYLNAGVAVVCVFDPGRSTVTVYHPDHPEKTYAEDETLTLPDVLPGFSVVVRRFFE
jgi:Uma2 family endonuclease